MTKLVAASALIVLLGAGGIASAAGPFDGNWSGEVVGSGPDAKNCTGSLKGTVASNALHGEMVIGRFKPTEFGGAVAADGNFKSPAGLITGQFTGGSFTGSMNVPNGRCNPYKLTMSRS